MDTGHGLESQTALINKLFIFPNYVNHLAGWVVTLSIEAAGLIPVDHVEVEKSESHSDSLLRWDSHYHSGFQFILHTQMGLANAAFSVEKQVCWAFGGVNLGKKQEELPRFREKIRV